MNDTQSYAIDIINLVADNSLCYIQAPSSENSEFLNLMKPSPFPCYNQILLTSNNKKQLTELISKDNIEEEFQSIEIRYNDKLIFEGYDGMEYGTISKNLILPEQFKDKYFKEEMYIVSKEW